MHWLDVVAPAFLVAIVATMDARMGRPYWAFSQILPAVAQIPPYADRSIFAELLTDVGVFRNTARRFAYALVPGVWLALRYQSLTPVEAAAPGVVAAVALLWPMFFHGLPPVQNRTGLLVLYAGIVVVFGALCSFAYVVVHAALTFNSVGPASLLLDELAISVFLLVLTIVGGTLIRVAWSRLRPLVPWQ